MPCTWSYFILKRILKNEGREVFLEVALKYWKLRLPACMLARAPRAGSPHWVVALSFGNQGAYFVWLRSSSFATQKRRKPWQRFQSTLRTCSKPAAPVLRVTFVWIGGPVFG